MRTELLAATLIFFSPCQALANGQIDVDTGEFSATDRIAPAPRALALGVEGVALASDGSSASANPAGLTAIRRIEISATLAGTMREQESRFFDRAARDELYATALTEAHLVLPMPTYRGGLVFSLGYHQARPAQRTSIFDGFNTTRPAEFGDGPSREFERARWRGGPSAFIVAGAVDLSPRTTVGLALDVWRGEEERSRRFELGFVDDDSPDAPAEIVLEDGYTIEHTGFGFRAGIMIRAAGPLRIGATIEAPFDLKRKGSFNTTTTMFDPQGNELDRQSERFDVDETIRLPWSISAGAALHVGRLLLLSADGRFSDFPRMEYAVPDSTIWPSLTDDPPYRVGLEAGGGAELIVPGTTLRARAGYRFVRPPYLRETSLSGRHRFSAGAGWIIDGAFSLDVAALRETSDVEQFESVYTASSTRTRFVIGTAYRF